MRLTDDLQSLIEAQDWLGLALALWGRTEAISYFRLGLAAFAALVLLMLMPGVALWLLRLPFRLAWWPFGHVLGSLGLGRQRDAWSVDGLTIDRHDRHCAWLGPTGAGKSSGAVTRVDGRRPTLIIACDTSDPLEAATRRVGGIVWTPDGLLAWDPLIGEPRAVARRLAVAFPQTGKAEVFRRVVRRRVAQVVETMDREGEPRTLAGIVDRLEAEMGKGRLRDAALEGWIERFADLAEDCGPTLGPGLDLEMALRAGKTVMITTDAHATPGMVGTVGSLALQDALRCAVALEHHGGFRLIVEEAGQMDEHVEVFDTIFRAGRRRHVPVDILTQFGGDLGPVIRQNVTVWALFAQEEESAKRDCANKTGLEREAFDEGALPRYTAWVKAGSTLRLVRFPRPPGGPVQTGREPHLMLDRPARDRPQLLRSNGRQMKSGAGLSLVPSLTTPQIGTASNDHQISEGVPIWVEGDPDAERIWRRGVDRLSVLGTPCRIWQGADNGNGRPKTSVGRKTVTVYIWTWEKANGRRVPPERPTLDHICHTRDETCPGGAACVHTRCFNPEHLDPCGIPEQAARQAEQKRRHREWAEAQTVASGRSAAAAD